MSKYFDKIPKIIYDIEGKQSTTYQTVTNIFFRVRVIRSVLNNLSAYYDYLIKDNDTPEILAEKVYGDPEAHWIILMSNEIVDSNYDWPLNNRDFNEYIISKYGSIQNAKTQIHHYEMVITRRNSIADLVTETRFVINEDQLTVNNMEDNLHYSTYENLTETQSVETPNLDDHETVEVITKREAVSLYDYEYGLNEQKRAIKIIKPEYYAQIVREFDKLTGINDRLTYIRRLV